MNKSKDLTNMFIQLLNKHPEELEELEGSIRFNLSSHNAPHSVNKVISVSRKMLENVLQLDETQAFYNDSDDGEVRVISSFFIDLINELGDLVDFDFISTAIAEKIWVKGNKEYRFEKYTLNKLPLKD